MKTHIIIQEADDERRAAFRFYESRAIRLALDFLSEVDLASDVHTRIILMVTLCSLLQLLICVEIRIIGGRN